MKNKPSVFASNNSSSDSSKRIRGRPVASQLEDSFKFAMTFLEENYDEQITVADLVTKMKEHSEEAVYSTTYMKQKIKEYFGDNVIITEINGKHNVVTLRNTAASILQEFYHSQERENLDAEAKKADIIKTGSLLIRNDIRLKSVDKSMYPSPEDLSSTEQNLNYLPDSLKTFLQTVFSHKTPQDLKIASVGQAVMQACRPRGLIAPLQVGLGVQLHHHFASKFLIDTLSVFGFCSSYTEIQKFESSAAVTNGVDLPNFVSDSFVQYVGDNVDHNIRTLDGHGTFHGMGIIACTTPGTRNDNPVKRLDVSREDIISAGSICIKYYTQQKDITTVSLTFEELSSLRSVVSTAPLNDLIRFTWCVRPNRPGWSGLMQLLQKGTSPGKSSVTFLPMIDMPPSDMSCIYTTLQFVSDHAARYNLCPILTFDQPLYWKAMNIILNEPTSSILRRIVLRLGGFHTLMSFLGSIGHLMNGSGLVQVLETVYAPNAVIHMMSGKSVARAIRGHLLVERALSIILAKTLFNVQIPDESLTVSADESDSLETNVINFPSPTEHENSRCIIAKIGDVFDDIMSSKMEVSALDNHSLLNDVRQACSNEKDKLLTHRTAALWLQYLEMLEIMQLFLTAERTGDWFLHLQTMTRMLPYFAAAGHNLYLRSAYVYLQMMQQLDKTNPQVYQMFKSGYHVVRRTERFWAGLSTDLVIEQVLMRSVKTTGGLTRGKGMSESKRLQWLLSLPFCAEVNRALQDLCGISYHTSDQHKECGDTRMARDVQDVNVILNFLLERQPFSLGDTSALRNIETGVEADPCVNVDKAKEIGEKVIKRMVGQSAIQYSFKKSEQVVVMNPKTSKTIDSDLTQVDPQLLFQRLVTAVTRSPEDDISNLFDFELSSFPAALFENSGLLRLPQKAALADAIWAIGDCEASSLEVSGLNIQYVLDGGSLLHRVPWITGMTYGDICFSYLQYIRRKYTDGFVVFDGYQSGPSTKDVCHFRRSHGFIGSNVAFTSNTPFKGKKDVFLSNPKNKQNFLNLLSDSLESNGVSVKHASEDADYLITKTACDIAHTRNVMLIGDDTDLLVLLCYHVCLDGHKVLFKSVGRYNSKKLRIWDIQKTKLALGEKICSVLPVLHALTGCDTTSRVFGIGKGMALKKLISCEPLQTYLDTFAQTSSKHHIQTAGENALVFLCGGIEFEGLNLVRFRKFVKKTTSSTSSVQIHSLPPTSDSAKFHSYRVYFQVQQWINGGLDLQPTDWGWTLIDNKLVPIKTDKPPAPENLLKIIKCNCKSNCDTRRCTCRKHGLECTVGCGECRGTSCTNVSTITEEDMNEDL